MGRTGRWLECTRELDAQSMPDAITLAKGLGGGFPIGALLVNGAENLSILQAGMHGTTFGGNPLACAAALATLSVIEEENLLASAQHLGNSVRAHIEKVVGVASTSGAGLLIGIQLESDVTASGDPLGSLLRIYCPRKRFYPQRNGCENFTYCPAPDYQRCRAE